MNTITRTLATGLLLAVVAVGVTTSWAAPPPPYINYQGVLRDAADNPLDGTHDMVFRFYSGLDEEILIDHHTAALGGAITVSGGLFNLQLGTGSIADGSGPGAYGSLTEVFRDYNEVWLEVQIGAEVLSPRTRVLAAAYALNAGTVGGFDPTYFLDISSDPQIKTGPLTVDAGAVAGSTGVTGVGEFFGGHFSNTGITGSAYLALANAGIDARGNNFGGYFADDDSSGNAHVGFGDTGIDARGSLLGGVFQDTDNSGLAQVGYGDYGIRAYGNSTGGYFGDLDSSGYAYVGYGDVGISSHGATFGGRFWDADSSGYAELAHGDTGVSGYGNSIGGYFEDADDTGFARLGAGNNGLYAYGSQAGGYFGDSDGSGYAWVGYGNTGIEARGSARGGYFANTNGTSYARIGLSGTGLDAYGTGAGGFFSDSDDTGYAYLGRGDTGIDARGSFRGGYFQDTDHSGYAYVAYEDRGIWARGNFAGGTFSHPNGTSYWADVSQCYGSPICTNYKIRGVGAVSFVQNHPEDPNRVIVYAAPEGDEVATYTRGTARLVDGEARVALGDTFRWVTNPDIGLTAHLTAHDVAVPLAVVSLTPTELVVRGPGEGPYDVTFDYLVYGLRIGFERASVIQAKDREALLPGQEIGPEFYDAEPDPAGKPALDRFRAMKSEVDRVAAEELTFDRAVELRQSILASGWQQLGRVDPAQERADLERPEPPVPQSERAPDSEATGEPATIATTPGIDPTLGNERSVEVSSPYPKFPMSEPVEPGDLLVLDPERPGRFRLAGSAADPTVVGIVAGEALEGADRSVAPVAGTGFVLVKADAGYGEIRPGDLLTSSFTPGHAMRTTEIVPGTIIGKALEPLETGTGLIRVLVMPR